ncbi:hypothetical protein EDD36DRAFT_226378 [Exophiala viscosa]|uniref:RING-type E3 ubiquitin transferase n=1 Tax=Exophiala viscosa TaxID=2486360 RepID=A0AAN6DXF2_9EURO|nr:hypothetical protein EDD36DRAFT_226378 [Exophiala viscosa]
MEVSHTESSTLRANAEEFVTLAPRMCHFFSKGRCRNGDACKFSHLPLNNEAPQSDQQEGSAASDDVLRHADPAVRNPNIQLSMEGAVVQFGPGAEVQDVLFPALEALVTGKIRGNTPMTKVQIRTVCCSWFNASKLAYLHYKSPTWANSAAKRFEKKFEGRQVQTKIIPPPAHHGSKTSIWSVKLGNLCADSNEAQLLDILKNLRPEKMAFGKATSHTTVEEAIYSVKQLLSQSGLKVEAFDAIQTPSGSKTRLFIRFKTFSDVQLALDLSGTLPPKMDSKVYVEQMTTVKIPVLEEMYSVLGFAIQKLQEEKSDGTQISIHDDQRHKPVSIRIYGQKCKGVAKVKAEVEKLLKGEVVLHDDSTILWDDFFGISAGFSYIRSLSQPGKLFVYRDALRRQLRLYGSADLKQLARQALLTYLKIRGQCLHCIPLDGELWHTALHGGFRQVISRFGKEKAKLDITQTPRLLVIQGSPEDAQAAREIIAAVAEDESIGTRDEKGKECPACLSMAENPVELSCGHQYCRDCFEDQCRAAEVGRLPITCYGDESKCQRAVPLAALQEVLLHEQYEDLLSWSLKHHVRSHPTTLSYCPTPDCPTIFRLTDEAMALPCEHCLTSICTKCCTASHEGLPCDASDEEKSVEGRKNQQYMEKNNIRTCSNCRARISKIEGCYHIACVCGKHFCWLCEAVFDSDPECYGHLRQVHGRISDEHAHLDDENVDPEGEDDDLDMQDPHIQNLLLAGLIAIGR